MVSPRRLIDLWLEVVYFSKNNFSKNSKNDIQIFENFRKFSKKIEKNLLHNFFRIFQKNSKLIFRKFSKKNMFENFRKFSKKDNVYLWCLSLFEQFCYLCKHALANYVGYLLLLHFIYGGQDYSSSVCASSVGSRIETAIVSYIIYRTMSELLLMAAL
jgi:hypothetical protein